MYINLVVQMLSCVLAMLSCVLAMLSCVLAMCSAHLHFLVLNSLIIFWTPVSFRKSVLLALSFVASPIVLSVSFPQHCNYQLSILLYFLCCCPHLYSM